MGYGRSWPVASAPPPAAANTTSSPVRYPRRVNARRRLHSIGQRRQPSGTVAELLDRNAQLLEDRHVQIRERRPLGMPHVAPAPETGGLAADERDRQVVVEVRVAVADAGAVQQQRVVEHLPVCFGNRRELLDEIRELLEVVLVDLVQPFELGG